MSFTTGVQSGCDDSDFEPTADDFELKELSWRLSPEESFSDWRIELVSQQETTTTSQNEGAALSTAAVTISPENTTCTSAKKKSKTVVAAYNVHRNTLAVGPCRSAYFARLFRSKFSESADSTSRIELPDALAVRAFPQFLDFIYTKQVKIDDDSVVALHYLGQYFEVRQLRREARKYLSRHLNDETCQLFYEHAKIFHDEKVRNLLVAFFAERVNTGETVTVIPNGDAQFWLDVLEKAVPEYPPGHLSRYASIIISYAIMMLKDQLDDTTFNQLTDKKYLPVLESNAAERLLGICNELFPDNSSKENGMDSANGNRGDEGLKLSCLQERCVTAMVDDWRALNVTSEATMARLKKQNSGFLVKLMCRITERAQQDCSVLAQHLGETDSDPWEG